MTSLSGGKILCTLQGVTVVQYPVDKRIKFTADAAIDADGAPRAYHPDSRLGLDDLANAGHPGNWWGIETDTGQPDGMPVIQSASDPAPGFYISSTAYEWPQFNHLDPRRYLDASKVPFIVIEGFIRRRARGVVLGCRARITNETTGVSVEAMAGDTGPLEAIGELSIAAALDLGINADARKGGASEHIITYELWPDAPAVLDGVRYNLIPYRP